MRRWRRQSERGQAAVEFALVAPLLFIVVFAIIQCGLVFGKQLDLKSATADAARRAAVSINQSDPGFVAKQTFQQQLTLSDATNATFTVSPAAPWTHGQTITVTASVPDAYSIMGVSSWSGTLKAKSKIRVE